MKHVQKFVNWTSGIMRNVLPSFVCGNCGASFGTLGEWAAHRQSCGE